MKLGVVGWQNGGHVIWRSTTSQEFFFIAYCFPEVDNFLVANNVAAPNITAINAIRPKNSTSANIKPGPCFIRSINERIEAPPETRAIRSRRLHTIHSPIDIILFMITRP
jgi:hypothetical protein